MNLIVPRELCDLAEEILVLESARQPDMQAPELAIERALGRLHAVMVRLVGSVGYAAILRRAIRLVGAEYPWLMQVTVRSPFEVVHLGDVAAVAGGDAAVEGATRLLAVVLHLLCSFIGEELTLRQVREVWTELSLERGMSKPSKETT